MIMLMMVKMMMMMMMAMTFSSYTPSPSTGFPRHSWCYKHPTDPTLSILAAIAITTKANIGVIIIIPTSSTSLKFPDPPFSALFFTSNTLIFTHPKVSISSSPGSQSEGRWEDLLEQSLPFQLPLPEAPPQMGIMVNGGGDVEGVKNSTNNLCLLHLLSVYNRGGSYR